MTDIQYVILGLIVLGIAMNFSKIARLVRGETPVKPPGPTAQPGTLALPSPTSSTLDPTTLGGLFHQAIAAESQTRAIRRGVESMIEDESKKVKLPWSGPSGESPVPNG